MNGDLAGRTSIDLNCRQSRCENFAISDRLHARQGNPGRQRGMDKNRDVKLVREAGRRANVIIVGHNDPGDPSLSAQKGEWIGREEDRVDQKGAPVSRDCGRKQVCLDRWIVKTPEGDARHNRFDI